MSISASELRLGSIVKSTTHNQITIVNLIDEYRDYSKIEPILITQEWLENLGFTKSDYPNYTLKVSALTLTCRIQIGINYSEFGGIYFGDKFKYVHQLQNLYHSLTGNELTLSKPF